MNIVKLAAAGGLMLAAASVAIAEGTTGDQTRKGQTQQGQTPSSGDPVVLIVPFVVATDEAMARGCWARLYDSTDYSGNMLTLSGPVDIPTMESGRIAGFEWDRNFDSVIVGPKATLMVWQGDTYSGQSTSFRPNQRVPDLDVRMGYFDDIDSLKVSCLDTGGTGGASGGSRR